MPNMNNGSSKDPHFISLYSTLDDPKIDIKQKLDILTKFKGHVKKEFINIENIPTYIDALLLISQKFKDSIDTLFLGHSCLCYLIKRIAIQSPESLSQPLITNLINGIIELHTLTNMQNPISSHNMKKFWLLTIKILESCYTINPIYTEDSIKQSLEGEITSMIDNSSNNIHILNRIKVILFIINELCQIKQNNDQNPLSSLRFFNPVVLRFLNTITEQSFNDKNSVNSIVELISDIFRKYVDQTNFEEFVKNITNNSIRNIFSQEYQQPDVRLNNTFDTENELQSILNDAKPPSQLLSRNVDMSHNSSLLYTSLDQLSDDLENALEPFHNPKETEKNWKIRQSNIIKIKNIFLLNEKLILEEKTEFVNILKTLNFVDCISKTALSLRTTLSLNTCQLIKDLILLLKDSLTIPLLDHIFTTLKILLASTKKLSSQMGYFCLLIMFLNVDFHSKLFHDSLLLISEKNVIQRNTSAIILRIILIKANHTSKLDSNLVYIEEWIRKGISDAQTQVREAMRITFWYYYKAYPVNAKNLLNNSFSAQLKKAIELAIPEHLDIDYRRQYQGTFSNSSSRNSSRRSSLLSSHLQNNTSLNRKFPSYAQPTQSSISQKNKAGMTRTNRSTSEMVTSNKGSTIADTVENKRLKTNDGTIIKRKISAPISSNKTHYDSNLNQLDLTGELPNSQSISLINKYMDMNIPDNNSTSIESPDENQNNEALEKLYSSSRNEKQYKEFLQLLQNYILIPQSNETDKLDFKKIIPSLRKLIIKHPSDFKPLLSIQRFVTNTPISCVIELFAINNIDPNELISTLDITTIPDTTKILDDIGKLLVSLTISSDPSTSIFYMKYRRTIFDFVLNVLHKLLSDNGTTELIKENTFENILSNLFKIYGNEMDNQQYFDILYRCYLFNNQAFIKRLKELQFVSIKLKICEELQQKDNNLKLNNIILGNKQDDNNNDIQVRENEHPKFVEEQLKHNKMDNLSDNEVEENDPEIRKYMEMTMVNPFKQQRSISSESVVHNPELTTKNNGHEHDTFNPDQTGLTTLNPRLYEMTKIVSVYQTTDQPCSTTVDLDTESDNMKIKENKVSHIGLSDIFQDGSKKIKQENADFKPISSILNENSKIKSEEDEHTVKFTDNSPEIIGEENKVPHLESKEMSDSNRAIKRTGAPTPSVVDMNNMSSEETKDNSSSFIITYPILHKFENCPITLYELAKVISRRKPLSENVSKFESANIDLKQLQNGVSRIQSGTFTIKHLNHLIEPLVTLCSSNTVLLSWLDDESGYDQLLALSLMLLQSMDEASLIPTTMTRKAILLIQCVLAVNEYNGRSINDFDVGTINGIWAQFTIMVDKLLHFTNEIYLLICETRSTLIKLNYFKPKSITSILSSLVTELPEDITDNDYRNEFDETKIIGNLLTENNISYNAIDKLRLKIGLKQSFMISTIIGVLQTKPSEFKTFQLSEIIQTMSFFVRKTNSDWRYNSISVAVEIFKILYSRENKNLQEINQIFSCLDAETYKLIKIMGQPM
ncbi:similar to Saccharomyces cerevisiae YBL034C STU1 Component of the mitotic spindle that binds to interpolar microtubules via its association with beta- tubulin (Tub2p) [Maudiozyma barnettii]|uniref:Protein STU1 n=1 Tax=Maudiozyma barnettii TaxID=61262 RepID=A0A8H2VD36_9SACH|nr:Stu1p [Kazachstania barnettii]CAB4253096.1 similar to Saccharomyces cerevisiae YBL034C STU1 Component of the mitotic spindle that binds to interpolar microtubules via its association with beta- tubulin (Tub2p) [Kazachstania barnettii]CAD1780369.1 similar to Saccharomyces cerevisiae YBL034C STU1 Component of the mitotic spindle that binds to interpolar microtubules via its association with beta- tubulin (Tub2p) [Kazachstania barnettii]